MKNLYLPIVFFLTCIQLQSQSFTKVTTGDFVTDGGALSTNWGDFNQDGWNDLFYTGNGGPRLYKNNGNGTFTAVAGGDLTQFGTGISGTWGDYNRDGYPDLFKSHPNFGTKLYLNNGDETFSKIEMEPFLSDSADFQGNSWADYDNDGHLDLFVAVGGNDGPTPNRLYHNLGDGTFESITDDPVVTVEGGSVDGSWVDYNNDGFIDLYISNGAGGVGDFENYLLKNNGDGTFSEITTGIIAEDEIISLGSSWGDFDNDGDFDLFVAGLGAPNGFYINEGDDVFTKISTGPQVENLFNTIGSSCGDLDNDGDLDILVTNFANNQVFLNNGDATFTELTNDPLVDETIVSIGCSLCDFDHDGDLDVSITNVSDDNSFFINNDNNNHWINILCVGTVSNISAIGTKVKVKANINGQPVWQLRQVQGQTGVLGQNSLNVEFGLGDATIIDSLIIEWPSGIVFDTTNMAVDQYSTQIEHLPVGVSQPGLPAGYLLHQNYPNPFVGQTNITYTLPKATNISLELYDQKGTRTMLVQDLQKPAGTHTYAFEATDLPPGVYYCTLRIKEGASTRKIILIE